MERLVSVEDGMDPNLKAISMVVLEERAAIRSLLGDWLVRELKCKAEYIFEYWCGQLDPSALRFKLE